LDVEGNFKIGERNFATIRKFMWKNGILISAQDVGGTKARTMALDMRSGATTLKSQGKEWLMKVNAKPSSRPSEKAVASGVIGGIQNVS
jgi:chemotaxis receptor (MCP) glutamine deamidase CheD